MNLALLVLPIGGTAAILTRFAAGALMAGIWPISMKLAIGWSKSHRGFLMGLLVAALVVGQAVPYLLAWFGGTNWRVAVILASAVTALGGGAIMLTRLGPYHARNHAFRTRAIALAWQEPRIRAPILGYLGHMWEFIAFWTWVGTICAASFAATLPEEQATTLGKLAGFFCIIAAAPACVATGRLADRFGKARLACIALATSGTCAILTALTFEGPVWLTFLLVIIWGAMVVPDSPQFSALVADHAPPELTGSLLTFQAALGFLLTALTVQISPLIADAFGWPVLMGLLALGPAFGLWAMRPALKQDSGAGAV